MAGKNLDPSSSPRALLGAELRVAREAAGLSQAELGEPLFVSGSFIGQLEAGTRRMHIEFARQIDNILSTNGFFVRNCGALAKSKYPNHFAEAAEAEAEAKTIREYAPLALPGMLQTEAYAREVFIAYQPTATDEVIGELVANRLHRAKLLANPTTPLLWCVIDETLLRRVVGGTKVMAEALRHVASLIRRRRIFVQVLPFAAGAHSSMGGTLKLMTFDAAPPLAYVQGNAMGVLLDDPATVARHSLTYDLLTASALSPSQSLALIESAAEDYEHDQHA
ncbi:MULTISPECIES: helix-turn-helix domain-containing protein [Streptomyces]|uniref:Transcriptional regulator n=1 Tax=Streptomyces virginiae TaxID=1961 RepID=A0ABQ3NVH4_STRVG|nr:MULTISPECIES: helix-turn-helix transcriptional regulator [Streptomyces]GLV90290.1 transcriptional regulator [Streptomyces lavendulae subsp. lavendulae]KOU13889.1 XRE family transcriptional regulator [Streptomyces sp. WM6349]KOV40852.1 XRE family transcriptional regulator [Streptomyces sp. H036]MBP2344865.1 transcriptional regulator with XRE-family HTH domain [Streptomyces virginiae]GGP89628.1 transcriptional regulator [Streptomyces virginiae]